MYKTSKQSSQESKKWKIPNRHSRNIKHLKIIAYSDDSFANLTDGESQGGYIFFLVGSTNRYMPIAWQSIRRVVKNNLAAETLSMVDAAETCLFYRKFLLRTLATWR